MDKNNKLIGEFLGAKTVRKAIDVNIYIGDVKQLKSGYWTKHQAWEAFTNPKIPNYNNSFEKLLPVFFKIISEKGKEHVITKKLINMLLENNVKGFYEIVLNYINKKTTPPSPTTPRI